MTTQLLTKLSALITSLDSTNLQSEFTSFLLISCERSISISCHLMSLPNFFCLTLSKLYLATFYEMLFQAEKLRVARLKKESSRREKEHKAKIERA